MMSTQFTDLNDFVQNHAETHLQGISLLLQQAMSFVSSSETSFHQHLSSERMKILSIKNFQF